MMAFNRRRWKARATRQPKAAVTSDSIVMQRKGRCATCKHRLSPGDLVMRLRLMKRYQQACTTCGHNPALLKYYHETCAPQDLNRAMSYDPNTPATSQGGAVSPPAKPKTVEALELEALAALETCVVARASRQGRITPELEAKFKTFQNIKARVLRPGTPGEGEAATAVALSRIIKMVFATEGGRS